jgi:hypothetical protein
MLQEDKSTANLLLDFHKDKSTGLFPELTLKELVLVCCEYYSIFQLQQEASALWNTVVINNNGILTHFS